MTEFRDSGGFPLVGSPCTYKYCGERDFLPFKCELCEGAYCLKHAEPRSHECEKWTPQTAELTSVRVFVCPICRKPVRYDHTDPSGVEVAWGKHESECTGPAEEIPRCPVEGCKNKLTTSGSVACTTCGMRVCLKHRYEDMHPCRKSVRAGGGRSGWLDNLENKTGKKSVASNAYATKTPALAPTVSSIVPVVKAVPTPKTIAGHEDSQQRRLALAAAFREMESKADAVQQETCCRTLLKIFENIMNNPAEEKFRRLSCSNAAIASKILSIPGGRDVLSASSWRGVDDGQFLELSMEITAEHIQVALNEIRSHLSVASAKASAIKSEPPPDQVPAKRIEQEPWSCPRCTLANEADVSSCSACGNAR